MSHDITWLFKPVVLNNKLLSLFQKELLNLVYHIEPNLPTRENYLVSETDRAVIQEICPYFYKHLRVLKLNEFLVRIGFVIVSQPRTIIHSDYPASSYALNIPILNCADSYTVWYDSKITDKTATDYNSKSWLEVGLSPLYELENSVEIGRIDSNQPHWVNVRTPHTPECHHDKLRINCTVRFTDDIVDYLAKL